MWKWKGIRIGRQRRRHDNTRVQGYEGIQSESLIKVGPPYIVAKGSIRNTKLYT